MTFFFDMVVVRASNSLIDMRYDDYSFWIKQSRIEMGARVGNYLKVNPFPQFSGACLSFKLHSGHVSALDCGRCLGELAIQRHVQVDS